MTYKTQETYRYNLKNLYNFINISLYKYNPTPYSTKTANIMFVIYRALLFNKILFYENLYLFCIHKYLLYVDASLIPIVNAFYDVIHTRFSLSLSLFIQ